MSLLMIVHIVSGSAAVFSGFMALFSKKGAPHHRNWGKLFVFAMAIMAVSSSVIAFQRSLALPLIVGIFTFYLVATSWATVGWKKNNIRYFNLTMTLVVFGMTTACFIFSIIALNNLEGHYSGIPARAYLFFGLILLVVCCLDLNFIIKCEIAPPQRLARHLWRMCLSLYLATGSLFTGPGAKVFPESLQGSAILAIPESVTILLMLFWLIKTFYFGKLKVQKT